MNKKILLIALSLSGALYSEAQVKKVVKKPSTPAKKVAATGIIIKSSLDSVSYAFGYSIAQDLKSRGVTNLNFALMNNAMADVFKDSKPDIAAEQCQQTIYAFLSSINKNKFSGVMEEGSKFLAENKTKAGVVTTSSGLQYLVLQAGTGPKPKATDEVTVHYKGTLLSGKQFDSSYDRGQPISFPLNQVIPGWTEGVQLMPIGSKYRFFIPYQLAYGEKGAGQDIPPYSVLIFEVELIKFGKETPNVEPKPIK
jgi:FKBP-type peptidyl-prolyl cis-trans isomerase